MTPGTTYLIGSNSLVFSVAVGSSHDNPSTTTSMRRRRSAVASSRAPSWPALSGCAKMVTASGPPGARAYAPVCIAFRLRNGVSTRNMNLCGAQWLAYVLLCRRFAVTFTGDHARLVVDVDRYSFIVSDLHRLLIAGLPAHCETFCTSSLGTSPGDTATAKAMPATLIAHHPSRRNFDAFLHREREGTHDFLQFLRFIGHIGQQITKPE